MTKFDFSQKPWWSFAFEAALEALEDARLKISEIEFIVFTSISTCSDPRQEHQTHKISFLSDLFKTHVPIVEVPSVCAGGGVAAWIALQTKNFKNILVVAGERVVTGTAEDTTDKILSAAEKITEQAEGLLFPAQNALVWQQYMQRYRATMDDLSLIAFKNHQNAVLNPKAYYFKRPVTLDEIKNSPPVSSPLRLMDCSLSVNGGAAVILSQERADVEIIGSGFATDYLLTFGREEFWHFRATGQAAETAFRMAKVDANDIQVAEVHDAFTSVELFSYEDLGFVPLGRGAELIRSGKVNLGGELPVNPSGGLKAKGHPISVTGLAQIYEITNQLRGRCGEHQIKPFPRLGLCHNVGGAGGSVTVHVLRKN